MGGWLSWVGQTQEKQWFPGFKPARDKKIVERYERTSILGWGDFGDKHGHRHGSYANANSDDQPADDEHMKRARNAKHHGSRNEHNRGENNARAAAKRFIQRRAGRRAENSREYRGGHHDLVLYRSEAEVTNYQNYSSRDNARVVTE